MSKNIFNSFRAHHNKVGFLEKNQDIINLSSKINYLKNTNMIQST